MTVIADIEQLIGAYLRDHPDVAGLGARVAGRTPSGQTAPWVRVTLLDPADHRSGLEYLVDYLVQLDIYAGVAAMTAHTGQAEASLLARTVRAAVKAMQGQTIDGVVFTEVAFQGMPRIPDTDFEPARERYILTTRIVGHPA